ncbi:MAG: hypothetical protein J0I84_07455 [Terrimonas sp.]|nr:hypothetical protein [Terrimonas sp.]OJY97938.1 MAG: hypothetical protein BGP13_09740 [Sphingobacteriales bacterium 40-81]
MKRQLLIDMICGLLILLFVYASVSKLLDYPKYYGEINGQPLPNILTPFIVWTLPTLEILIAIGLMIERTRLIALWASFILMSLFTLYVGLILANFFGVIPCACGGVINNLGWKEHLLFNTFFTIIPLIAIWLNRKPKQKPKVTLSTS